MHRVKMEGIFDDHPFDKLAMIWLLVMGETGDFRISILKPNMIVRLNKLRTEYFRSRRQLAKLDESAKDGKPVTPILFTYWLAWEKDRLQELARVPAAAGDSPPVTSNWAPGLKDIEGIPSKTAAKESVREWIRSGEFRWDDYEKDVALQAAKAFEATAQ